MKREIKFRAWLSREEKMTPAFNVKNIPYIFAEGVPKDCIILQCTGVKDKNGVEIYEGDVVRHSQWSTKDGKSPLGADAWKIGHVYFKNGKFVVSDNETWDTFSYKHLEVICNIYQNPELCSK